MNIFYQIMPGLFDSMGGVSYGAIETVFKMNDLDIEVQRGYWPLILQMINIIKKQQNKKSDSGLVDAKGRKI